MTKKIVHRNNFLYLFYQNYAKYNLSGAKFLDVQNKMRSKKEGILRQGLRTAQKYSSKHNSWEDTSVASRILNMKEEDFQTKIDNMPVFQALTSFDQAQKALAEGVDEAGQEININDTIVKLMKSIEAIRDEGARLGGLTVGSINKISEYDAKINEYVAALKAETATPDITNAGQQALTSLSGTLLEIAAAVGFMKVAKDMSEEQENVALAIGKTPGVKAKYVKDPSFNKKITEIVDGLSSSGKEGKADNLFVSWDKASATISAVTLQAKNYKDIGSIGLKSVKTFGELGITNLYDQDFIVNTAGGLGAAHRQSKIGVQLRDTETWRDKDIAEIWVNIKRQLKIISVADIILALGLQEKGGLTGGLDYFIIRERFSGKVRLVSTQEIMQDLSDIYQKAIEKDENQWGFGINTRWFSLKDESSLGKRNPSLTRYNDYVKINVDAYTGPRGGSTKASAERSEAAYGQILQKVLSTKASLSLSFKKYM